MRMSYRALARLIGYPDAELRAGLPAIRAALHDEKRLSRARRAGLDALIDELGSDDALEVEARYVHTFDRSRASSLHLFEHVHGDSRDRGQAMVDLQETYAQAGLQLCANELPDFLPIALEFASSQPEATADAFVGEFAHILNKIHAALSGRRSRYAHVIAAALEIAGEALEATEADRDEPLDAAWEEPPAFDGCPAPVRSRDGAQPIHFYQQGASA